MGQTVLLTTCIIAHRPPPPLLPRRSHARGRDTARLAHDRIPLYAPQATRRTPATQLLQLLYMVSEPGRRGARLDRHDGPDARSRVLCAGPSGWPVMQLGPFFAIAWAISYPSYVQLALLVWGLLGVPFPQWRWPAQLPGRVLQALMAVELVVLAVLNIPGVLPAAPPMAPWVPYDVPFLSLGAQYLFFLGLAASLHRWVAPSARAADVATRAAAPHSSAVKTDDVTKGGTNYVAVAPASRHRRGPSVDSHAAATGAAGTGSTQTAAVRIGPCRRVWACPPPETHYP